MERVMGIEPACTAAHPLDVVRRHPWGSLVAAVAGGYLLTRRPRRLTRASCFAWRALRMLGPGAFLPALRVLAAWSTNAAKTRADATEATPTASGVAGATRPRA